MLQKQGINGPKPSFPFGNVSEMQQINQPPSLSLEALDEWAYSLYPYFHTWKQRYGTCMNTFRSPVFMYSTGTKQHLYVEIPELIKSIGDGILMSNGPNWTFQRNLLAPEFFQSKIMNRTYLYGLLLNKN
ncbi:Cytokinin hydroxylase [Glycine soja]|nr:Cytokinin hydroxylase [Glycine soja]